MCIRDSCRIWGRFSERFEAYGTGSELVDRSRWIGLDGHLWSMIKIEADDAKYLVRSYRCLLYTSDAADERSSVDLGGRRIIKKKKKRQTDVNKHVKKSKEELKR